MRKLSHRIIHIFTPFMCVCLRVKDEWWRESIVIARWYLKSQRIQRSGQKGGEKAEIVQDIQFCS